MLLACLVQHAGPLSVGYHAHAALLAAASLCLGGRLLTPVLFACLHSIRKRQIAACHNACRTSDAANKTLCCLKDSPCCNRQTRSAAC